MLKVIRSPVLRQFAVVIIANLTIINLGLNNAWASPMLIKLRDENQTILSRPVNQNEEAWIVGIGLLSALLGLLITGSLINWFGRKTVIVATYIPRLIMCFLCLFATEVWMILVARALGGMGDMVALSAVSTYVSEVAGKEIRGASGTVTQIMAAVGIMVMYSVGPFVSYLAINVLMTCIVAITFIPLLLVPESPHYLHAKGRTQESEEVLTFLRGSNELALEEIKEWSLFKELKTENTWALMKDRIVLKTTGIVFLLSVGMQMTGYNTISLYLQTVFEFTQTSVSSEISSLVIGFIQLVACLCTFVLNDRFGRKPILCTSVMGMCVGMIGLASFFTVFEIERDIDGFLNYLPLISIGIIIFGFNAGMGSMLWMLVAELYDSRIRPYGVSSAIFVTSSTAFVLILFFPSLINDIGAAITYWIFAAFSAGLSLAIFFLVPETKKRSFAEIQKALGRKEANLDSKS